MYKYFLLFLTINSIQKINPVNENKTSDQILSLNDKVYKEYLEDNKYILILFTAHFCKKTPSILKNLEKLKKSELFITENIDIIKSDILLNPKIKEFFNITKIPELYFIKKGVHHEFKGNLNNNEDIKNFIDKKIKDKVIGIENEEELKFYEDPMVVYFFFPEEEKEDNILLLEKIKTKFNDYVFVYFSNKDLKRRFFIEKKYALIFARDFEYDDAILEKDENLTFNEIFNFLEIHKEKDILLYDEEMNNKIWHDKKTTLFFFLDKANTQEYYDNLEIFQKLSKKYKGDMYFSISPITIGYGKNLIHYFGIFEQETPIYVFVKFENNGIKKYKFSGNTFESVEESYLSFKKGKIARFYRSEKSLTNDDYFIKKIVGEDFDKKVIQNNKNVFLMIYEEGSKNCEEMALIFKKLALVYENKIIFSRFDAGLNEHKSLRIKRLPLLIYYKNGISSITYENNYNGIKNFLDKMLKSKNNFNNDEL